MVIYDLLVICYCEIHLIQCDKKRKEERGNRCLLIYRTYYEIYNGFTRSRWRPLQSSLPVLKLKPKRVYNLTHNPSFC